MMRGRMDYTLVPDPPRAVPRRFSLRRMRAMIVCGVVFVVVGGVLGIGIPVTFFMYGGCVLPTVDLSLDRHHSLATAVITARQLLTHANLNGRHPWKISFAFSTPSGEGVDGVGYTLEQAAGIKEIGEALAVEYNPGIPSQARPVGGSASPLPLWVYGLIVGIFGLEFVIGAILLLVAWSRARGERILLTYGPGTDAEVVHVRRVRCVGFGKKNPYDVYYRFYDHRGLEVFGKDRTYHYGWAESLGPGDKVGVVYHPDVPEANVLYLHGKDVEVETCVR